MVPLPPGRGPDPRKGNVMAEQYDWSVVARTRGQRQYTVVVDGLSWREAVDAASKAAAPALYEALGLSIYYVSMETQAVLEDDGRWVPIKGRPTEHAPTTNVDCKYGCCQHTV